MLRMVVQQSAGLAARRNPHAMQPRQPGDVLALDMAGSLQARHRRWPGGLMNTLNDGSGEMPVVHIVEEDESSRLATARMLRTAGLTVRLYGSAPEFMANVPTGHGCVVFDLNLAGSR